MAKITPRRKLALDSPEEVYSLAQRLLERLKPYATWLVVAGVVVVVGLGAWGVKARMQASREEKAVAALSLVAPKVDLNVPAAADAKVLEQFVKDYGGTRAAREAQLLRANLLYRLKQYGEAAGLRNPPGWPGPGLGHPGHRKSQLLLRRPGELQKGGRGAQAPDGANLRTHEERSHAPAGPAL